MIVFSIVLFLYIHIYYHLKTSSDLEIYEIQDTTKENFEKICDLRQPVLFYSSFYEDIYPQFTILQLTKLFSHFDIHIRNCNVNHEYPNMHLYKSCMLEEGIKIIKSNPYVYSENNDHFLQESGLYKVIKQHDDHLRPSFLVQSKYDLLIGSQCITPLKYNVSYKNFIIPIEDSIQIKLVPPRYSSFMDIQKDFEYFQFLSGDNLWVDNYNKKIKSVTFTLHPRQILLIPAYWFYSFHFIKPNIILHLQYYTCMNIATIIPDMAMYLFQQQNIKYKTPCAIKKISEEDSKEDTDTDTKTKTKTNHNPDQQNIKLKKDINIKSEERAVNVV